MAQIVSHTKSKRKIIKNSRRSNRTEKKKSHHANPFGTKKLRKEAAKKRRDSNRGAKEKKRRGRAHRHARKISSFFNVDVITALAKTSKFLIRESKLVPIFFLSGIILSYFSGGDQSFALMCGHMEDWFNISVTPQAFSERLKQKETLNFLKKTFLNYLNQKIKKTTAEDECCKKFNMFSGIKIGDSSSIELSESLAKNFKGSGGGASKSALKLNVLADVFNYSTVHVDIKAGSYSDRNFAKTDIKYLRKGELLIRDLGYFMVEGFQKILDKKAFFISRFLKNVKIYLNNSSNGALDIYQFLREGTRGGKKIFDTKVFISEQKFECRLIAFKTPKWVVKQRAKKFKAMNKKEPSAEYLEWAGYSVFITNIDSSLCSSELIIELYRIRWKIELLFKSYKSTLKIDVIRGKNRNCVLCIVYAKLIGILMAEKVIFYIAISCENNREISVDRTIKWLKSGNRFVKAILNGTLDALLIQMSTSQLKFLIKEKRLTGFTTLKKVLDVHEDQKNSFLHKPKKKKVA